MEIAYFWLYLVSFRIHEHSTKVTHEIGVGYKGLLGKIIGWPLRKFYFTKAFEEALEKHAKEEFRNLEEII